MARKGAKKQAAASSSAAATAPATKPASLAEELSAANIDDANHDGYESSTHTDTDDFEDAADGSHTDEALNPAVVESQPIIEPTSPVAHDLSLEDTADPPQKLRRPSLLADADGQLATPKPTDAAFPDSAEALPTTEAESTATGDDMQTPDHVVASSSAATFVASPPHDKVHTIDAPPDTPLSSAEIRDSQSASDSLVLDEEKAKAALPERDAVPPSIGATSMLEPEETISNPFAADEPTQPIRFSRHDGGAAPGNPPDTPSVNSNHFSVVSLGSTTASAAGADEAAWAAAANSDARRDTITTNGEGKSADAAMTRSGESSNYDFLLARLETQNKRLSGDPKQMRASLDGAVKLREHFEKLRGQGQRHSRGESQNLADDEAATAATQQQQQHARESVVSTDTTAWEGPPVDEVKEDDIDWEFWGDVMSNYQSVARNHPRQLSRAIQAGIPAALRGMMWQLMSSSKNEEMEIIYAYYLKQTSSHEKAIRRDLNRTFPEQDYFQDGKGVGQENLYNVIKAYSLYDPEVGYCQGMQFVVGPLLLNMPDEEAFSTFVRLMKSYDLRGHFTPNMPALQLRLFQFDRLLEEMVPLLHRHLVRQGVKSSMYASQWFMTLFSYRFPLDLVYRILDSVFAEGVEALFRFAIALMKKNEEALLEQSFDQAVNFLKMNLFDQYLSNTTSAEGKPVYRTNEFVRDAFEIKITPFILDTYAAEFDAQVRAANAHRREVDALRLVNRNLAARVQALENQLNSLNAEHVEMVKDVVMAKIAKEEMAEDLVRYKMMYAEAVLAAEEQSSNHRSSAQAIAARQLEQHQRLSANSTSS